MRHLIIIAFLFISCNNDKGKESESAGQETRPVDQPVRRDTEECYWQVLNRDTLVAWLIQNGESVQGQLSFDNYQMDGSSGPARGIVEGDTIKLWYSFRAEGTSNVMEVWYRREDGTLLRGEGPSGVKGDTSYFTDHTKVSFDSGQRLQRVDCSDIPSKYKNAAN
jgi:hypothetical protein